MSWYSAGTISVTNGSTTVTGAGTAFVGSVVAGDALIGPDGRACEIGGVVSNTQLTLAKPYPSATAAGQSYAILPTQSYVGDLAAGAAALLNTFAAVRDGVGNGLFGDGSAAAPALRFGSDQDTGLFKLDENTLGFALGGVLRAYFSPAALVLPGVVETGLGAGAGDVRLEVGAQRNADGVAYIDLHAHAGTDFEARLFRDAGLNGSLQLINTGTGALVVAQAGAAPVLFTVGGVTRMRISENGPITIGADSDWTTLAKLGIKASGSQPYGLSAHNAESSGSAIIARVDNVNAGLANLYYQSTYVGGIATNGTSVSYATASDYRLKEDVQPVVDALDRLQQINVVNFAWKAGGDRCDGFLAHEVAEIVPEAVHGAKDAVGIGPDGVEAPIYQGVDQSKLVPLLIAAVQELTARVAALEAA